MEDYFRDFVHTLASFKSLTMECLSDLTENLIFLSENCPRDVDEMMPPSVSGKFNVDSFKEWVEFDRDRKYVC